MNEPENMEIVFFSDIIDELKNNLCYNLTKVRIQKFMDHRVLKTTETTTVTQNGKANIEVTDDELSASTFQKNAKAKVVKIDGKTVIQTYLRSTCNSPVNSSNAVGWCDVSSQNECKLKTDVEMTVLDESEQLRFSISVMHKVIEKLFNISVCSATKAEVIMKLMNKTFNFTLSRKGNTCLDMSY